MRTLLPGTYGLPGTLGGKIVGNDIDIGTPGTNEPPTIEGRFRFGMPSIERLFNPAEMVSEPDPDTSGLTFGITSGIAMVERIMDGAVLSVKVSSEVSKVSRA